MTIASRPPYSGTLLLSAYGLAGEQFPNSSTIAVMEAAGAIPCVDQR